MFFKIIQVLFFLLVSFSSIAQDTLQTKLHRWHLVISYTPSIFSQEPGIACSYSLTKKVAFEAKYNYYFLGAHINKVSFCTLVDMDWNVKGNELKLTIKFSNKFPKVSIIYKDLYVPKFDLYGEGDPCSYYTSRELRDEKRKFFVLNLNDFKKIFETNRFKMQYFYSVGIAYGTKRIIQYSYTLGSSHIIYPAGTSIKETIARPSLDVGVTFSFKVF